ncbi:hypothetical protein Dimus_012844, partial [Dionaea muscipula]
VFYSPLPSSSTDSHQDKLPTATFVGTFRSPPVPPLLSPSTTKEEDRSRQPPATYPTEEITTKPLCRRHVRSLDRVLESKSDISLPL